LLAICAISKKKNGNLFVGNEKLKETSLLLHIGGGEKEENGK
jgi:hypothetical protein